MGRDLQNAPRGGKAVIVRSILCVTLAGALAQLPSVSRAAAAPAPAAAKAQASLEIDVAALPDDEVTRELQAWLMDHQTKILQDGGVEVVRDAEVTIRVSVARYGEGDINYRATVVMIDQGHEASDGVVAQREIECEACRDSDLAARIGEEVARLSGRILYAPRETDTPRGAGETTQQPKSKVAAPVPSIGPLSFSGIGIATLGVGAAVAGGLLAKRPLDGRRVPDGAEVRNFRPTGIALASVGSAFVLAGAALIAVDVIRRHDKRKMSLLPTVGPSGVAFHVRF